MTPIKSTVEINKEVEIKKGGFPFVFVNTESRDVLISANTLLVSLHNSYSDPLDKLRITKIINALSDMVYGFEESEPTEGG